MTRMSLKSNPINGKIFLTLPHALLVRAGSWIGQTKNRELAAALPAGDVIARAERRDALDQHRACAAAAQTDRSDPAPR